MSSAFPKGKQNEDPEQKSYFIHRRITKARQNAQNVAWFLDDPMFLRFVYAQLGLYVELGDVVISQRIGYSFFSMAG